MSGYKIDFESKPPERFFLSRVPGDPARASALLGAVSSLLDRGVISPVPLEDQGSGFYSNLFVVPKKEGSVRPILDLKLLNKFLRVRKFRMESLRSVIASLLPGEFLASVDIQDAYLHVPIAESHQRYLRFAIGDRHYQFVALPFGLATAPRVFTKILAPIMALLRSRGISLLPYLDDILIKAPSFPQAVDSVQITVQTLEQFGWLINRPKSSLLPSQRLAFLGMILDTSLSKVFLPDSKSSQIQEAVRLLRSPQTLSIRQCMRTLGLMVASLEAIPYAQFHTRPLQRLILSRWDKSPLGLDSRVRLPPRVRASLSWWLSPPNLGSGRSFLPVVWTIVTTDASLSGWGGVLKDQTVQGVWSAEESRLPINILELRAIFLSLSHWTRILSGVPVRVQSDNASAVAYINHQGGTRSRAIMREVEWILQWAESNVPLLSAVYIPGVDNWTADFLSRTIVDPGEWSLHPEVFQELCRRWGRPDVDLMASRLNCKVPVYLARARDPKACGVDALVAPWQHFRLLYVFPPIPLLPKLLRRIALEGIPAILIAPDWPRRSWFADVVRMLADAPWPLPDREDLLSQGPLFHRNLRSLRLTAWLLKPSS